MPEYVEKNVGSKDKDVPWYTPHLTGDISPVTRQLLETYSKIPSDQVIDHIYTIRDKAWDVHPYPCIGGFRFLDLSISHSPFYNTILERLKTGKERFLDLGCCFGQDLRKLASDGAPSENLFGSDLQPDFLELGYELFRDRDTLKSTFLSADIFDAESPLKQLDGTIDIVYAGSFLHLFGYDEQKEICIRIVKLLKSKSDSMVLGRQVGNEVAGAKSKPNGRMYQHNVASFEQLWVEVGESTRTKWRVEAELKPMNELMVGTGSGRETHGWHAPGTCGLRFAVFQI